MGAVRATVRELGGRIEVRSEAGRGSTFRFVLPRAMLDESAERETPSMSPVKMVSESRAS